MPRKRRGENRNCNQTSRNLLREGIRERLGGRYRLDTEGLEGIAVLAGGLLLRHGAVAALYGLNAAVQRDHAGEGIERQKEVDGGQHDGNMLRTLHRRQHTTKTTESRQD